MQLLRHSSFRVSQNNCTQLSNRQHAIKINGSSSRRVSALAPAPHVRLATIRPRSRDPRRGVLRGSIMPEKRDALFVLGGVGLLALYRWVTMIAERMPWLVAPRGSAIGDQGAARTVTKMSLFDGTGPPNGQAEARRRRTSTPNPGRRPAHRPTSLSPVLPRS